MIISINITDSNAVKILEEIGQPYMWQIKPAFRSEGHNSLKEYEVQVLMVETETGFMPAKDWIEKTLDNSLIELMKATLTIKK